MKKDITFMPRVVDVMFEDMVIVSCYVVLLVYGRCSGVWLIGKLELMLTAL